MADKVLEYSKNLAQIAYRPIHSFMPFRYRPFYYDGPIDIEDWILRVWIPRHRSLGADRGWLESNLRYSRWIWISRSEIRVDFAAFEGPRIVDVIVKARVHRVNRQISKISVYYIHSRKQR